MIAWWLAAILSLVEQLLVSQRDLGGLEGFALLILSSVGC
jgi:hypothetical protein